MFRIAQRISKLPKNIAKRSVHFDPLHQNPPDADKLPSYKVTRDPEEWKFVERLLPKITTPEPPTENKRYPSGWKPQTVKPGEYPYYIKRSYNHMIPVYYHVSMRGLKRRTILRHIHGDIYALAEDLMAYLQAKQGDTWHKVEMRISEIAGEITLKGDHANNIKVWLEEKGF